MPTLVPLPTETEVLPPSATLRIFRDSDQDIGYRECLIYLDGKEVAGVDFRKHIEIEVAPGAHTLQASNRVLRSEKLQLDVLPGDRLTFQTGNVGGGCFLLLAWMLQLGIPRVFLRLEQPDQVGEDEYAIPDAWKLR